MKLIFVLLGFLFLSSCVHYKKTIFTENGDLDFGIKYDRYTTVNYKTIIGIRTHLKRLFYKNGKLVRFYKEVYIEKAASSKIIRCKDEYFSLGKRTYKKSYKQNGNTVEVKCDSISKKRESYKLNRKIKRSKEKF